MSSIQLPRPNEAQRARIQQVVHVLKTRPDTFDMITWMYTTPGQPRRTGSALTWPTGCGTTACIAGHALLLAGLDLHPGTCYVGEPSPVGADLLTIEQKAHELLGVPVAVFHLGRWPTSFYERLGSEAEAEVAASFLEALLEETHPVWADLERS